MKSPNLIPLNSGAYNARSYIANAQICENLFPEINPEEADPDVSVTHYPREGRRLLSACPAPAPGRGVFTLSNGNLYAVVGANVYAIDRNWQWTKLGSITAAPTPVSVSDNGANAVLVDGTPNGYTINMGSNAFANLADATGTFQGSRRVDFQDTFLAFATPGTNQWLVSLSNQVAFNALAIANKDSTPDPIQTIAFNLRQAWLLGTQNSEIWTLTGGTPFPYSEWPNTFVQYGCGAAYSLVRADVSLFWISRNEQGHAIAVKTNGYAVEAISTRALEYEWATYPTIADCVGGTFQQAGHTFIIFHFPTADVTWGYDLATKQWHKRTWIDQNGVTHREKTAFYAAVSQEAGYPKTIVGQDWQTGAIYALDPQYYTDNGQPIVCRRSFSHIMQGMKEITHVGFVADFETGGLTIDVDPYAGNPWSSAWSNAFGPLANVSGDGLAALCMRYSNTGGKSFGNYRQKHLVTTGRYRSLMRWRGLGMARDRVYELMWAYPGPSALQGAYLDPLMHSA